MRVMGPEEQVIFNEVKGVFDLHTNRPSFLKRLAITAAKLGMFRLAFTLQEWAGRRDLRKVVRALKKKI